MTIRLGEKESLLWTHHNPLLHSCTHRASRAVSGLMDFYRWVFPPAGGVLLLSAPTACWLRASLLHTPCPLLWVHTHASSLGFDSDLLNGFFKTPKQPSNPFVTPRQEHMCILNSGCFALRTKFTAQASAHWRAPHSPRSFRTHPDEWQRSLLCLEQNRKQTVP